MSLQRKIWITSILAALSFLPSARGFFITAQFASLGTPPDSGHEEITRQAFADIGRNFDTEFLGLPGSEAIDLLIEGNQASDLPRGRRRLNLNEFWGLSKEAEWNNPLTQELHFLRNRLAPKRLASAYDTCKGAQARIIKVAQAASEHWRKGLRADALFLLGHATHILQDSFSTAHVQRQEHAPQFDLQNICYYPASKAETSHTAPLASCFHDSVDDRDSIWLSATDKLSIKRAQMHWQSRGESVRPVDNIKSFDPNAFTLEERRGLLTHEARLARVATTRLLALVFEHWRTSKTLNLSQGLLSGTDVGLSAYVDVMPQGVARCEGLDRKPMDLP